MEVGAHVWLRSDASQWGWVPAVLTGKEDATINGIDVIHLTAENDPYFEGSHLSSPTTSSSSSGGGGFGRGNRGNGKGSPGKGKGSPGKGSRRSPRGSNYYASQRPFSVVLTVDPEQLKTADHDDIKLRNLPASYHRAEAEEGGMAMRMMSPPLRRGAADDDSSAAGVVGGVDDLIGLTHLHEPASRAADRRHERCKRRRRQRPFHLVESIARQSKDLLERRQQLRDLIAEMRRRIPIRIVDLDVRRHLGIHGKVPGQLEFGGRCVVRVNRTIRRLEEIHLVRHSRREDGDVVLVLCTKRGQPLLAHVLLPIGPIPLLPLFPATSDLRTAPTGCFPRTPTPTPRVLAARMVKRHVQRDLVAVGTGPARTRGGCEGRHSDAGQDKGQRQREGTRAYPSLCPTLRGRGQRGG